MGIGGFPETHPLSLRWLGMHGAAFANWAVNGEYKHRSSPSEPMVKLKDGADLLLSFGVRFDDRVTGKFEEFCKHGTIVHLDIDASELNKNRRVHLPVVGDIKDALARLNAMIARRPLNKKHTAWLAQIEEWKKKAPFAYSITSEIADSDHMKQHLQGQENQVILQQMVVEALYELTHGDAYVTTGMGLALRRLTEDAGLRARLGNAARRYWEAEGTSELMARDYQGLLEAARMAAGPALPAQWPAHLLADGTATGRRLAAEVGVPFPLDQPADGRI